MERNSHQLTVKFHHILDTATTGRVHDLIGHQGAIDCIAISSDGKLLASGSSDNSVNIW
ncbi:hypothetical protein EWS82_13250, partial [Staphylococcus xylosus]|nr:hypothetical protein [Staphylococcus xylosus]